MSSYQEKLDFDTCLHKTIMMLVANGKHSRWKVLATRCASVSPADPLSLACNPMLLWSCWRSTALTAPYHLTPSTLAQHVGLLPKTVNLAKHICILLAEVEQLLSRRCLCIVELSHADSSTVVTDVAADGWTVTARQCIKVCRADTAESQLPRKAWL